MSSLSSKILVFANKPHNRAFSQILLAAIAAYYTVKKLTGFSLSSWLDTIFHTQAATAASRMALIIVGYAIVIQLINIWNEYFPKNPVLKIEPEGISACIRLLNEEIAEHWTRIKKDEAHLKTRFLDAHNFKLNVGTAVESMAEHIRQSIKGIKVKGKDVFVSVYTVPDFENPEAPRHELKYLTHYPPNRDNVLTKSIFLHKNEFQEFACVKSIRSGQKHTSKVTCKDYARGSGKRRKTIKHYSGFAITADNLLLGYINLEFHNKDFFKDQESFDSYAENQLIGFKYLIEYQFLKSLFFSTIYPHIQEDRNESRAARQKNPS